MYSFAPMTIADARKICRWRYDPSLSLYNLYPSDMAMLLAPELAYHSLRRAWRLAGFACFGDDAQVTGGDYDEDGLDLGFGMNPALVGKGLGLSFVRAIMDHAVATWRPPMLRLTVATFNQRAIAVYRRAGFEAGQCFTGMTRRGIYDFVVMTCPVIP